MSTPTDHTRPLPADVVDRAVRCELSELLVDQCAHCRGVHDPEEDIARASYELAARTGGVR